MQQLFVLKGNLQRLVVEEILVISRFYVRRYSPPDSFVLPLHHQHFLAGHFASEFQLARVRNVLHYPDAAITRRVAFLHAEWREVSHPANRCLGIWQTLGLGNLVPLCLDSVQSTLNGGVPLQRFVQHVCQIEERHRLRLILCGARMPGNSVCFGFLRECRHRQPDRQEKDSNPAHRSVSSCQKRRCDSGQSALTTETLRAGLDEESTEGRLRGTVSRDGIPVLCGDRALWRHLQACRNRNWFGKVCGAARNL